MRTTAFSIIIVFMLALTACSQKPSPVTEQFLCDFLNPLGAGMTTDTPDHVMTRGELADLLMQLSGE